MGTHKTLNPGFKPWAYYKKIGVLTYPDTPKTILTHSSAYKFPTNRGVTLYGVCVPTCLKVLAFFLTKRIGAPQGETLGVI